MENCRAKRTSGTCAAAVAINAVSARHERIETLGKLAVRPLGKCMRLSTGAGRTRQLRGSRCQPRIILRSHNLHAPHVARLVRTVVGNCVMYRPDIVPHQHIALRPMVRMEKSILL